MLAMPEDMPPARRPREMTPEDWAAAAAALAETIRAAGDGLDGAGRAIGLADGQMGSHCGEDWAMRACGMLDHRLGAAIIARNLMPPDVSSLQVALYWDRTAAGGWRPFDGHDGPGAAARRLGRWSAERVRSAVDAHRWPRDRAEAIAALWGRVRLFADLSMEPARDRMVVRGWGDLFARGRGEESATGNDPMRHLRGLGDIAAACRWVGGATLAARGTAAHPAEIDVRIDHPALVPGQRIAPAALYARARVSCPGVLSVRPFDKGATEIRLSAEGARAARRSLETCLWGPPAGREEAESERGTGLPEARAAGSAAGARRVILWGIDP